MYHLAGDNWPKYRLESVQPLSNITLTTTLSQFVHNLVSVISFMFKVDCHDIPALYNVQFQLFPALLKCVTYY